MAFTLFAIQNRCEMASRRLLDPGRHVKALPLHELPADVEQRLRVLRPVGHGAHEFPARLRGPGWLQLHQGIALGKEERLYIEEAFAYTVLSRT